LPKWKSLPKLLTTLLSTGSLAKSANAYATAIFISWFILVARTSNAPLNIYGNAITLLTWFD